MYYTTTIEWQGNTGEGTRSYKAYERSYSIQINNKPEIAGSSDPAFRGDGSRHNPEDLLLASLSSCHLLTYLHLCADAGVVVTAYTDEATGTMVLTPGGGGHFSEVRLNPRVTVENSSMIAKANELHGLAHQHCFVASSCNFPVLHFPECTAEQ
jgi:organic hydroperoxide reductase OsmC/OhrA